MKQETAEKINSAAVDLYLHITGVSAASTMDVEIIKQCSIAQIQTASEYVQASNKTSKDEGMIRAYVSPESAAMIQQFATDLSIS